MFETVNPYATCSYSWNPSANKSFSPYKCNFNIFIKSRHIFELLNRNVERNIQRYFSDSDGFASCLKAQMLILQIAHSNMNYSEAVSHFSTFLFDEM